MPMRLRRHMTFANTISLIALFVALGGTSYAAVTLKRGSVKGSHIAPNAVTSPKVKNGSLLARDFKKGQLPVAPAKHFAYIAFDSPSTYAVGYGSGVLSVERVQSGMVDVRFNRNVQGCVAQATVGNVALTDDDSNRFTLFSMYIDPDDAVGVKDDVVRVIMTHTSSAFTNTSFLISLSC